MKKLFILMFSLLSVGAMAQDKVLPRYTENEKSAVNRCRNLDVSVLDSLKGAMVAQGISSGTATLANAGSIALTLTNKEDNFGKKLAANIMTGAGAVNSTTNLVISAVQLSKIKALIDDVEACQDGLNGIPDAATATTIKSDNKTHLND